jgi:hypothetical protein
MLDKSVTKNIVEILKSQKAIEEFLGLTGASHEAVQIFKYNWECLQPHVMEWQTIAIRLRKDLFSLLSSSESVVQKDNYRAFKNEIFANLEKNKTILKHEMEAMFNKYETPVIPEQSKLRFDKEVLVKLEQILQEKAKGFNREILYRPIPLNQNLLNVIKVLSGNDKLSLQYMLVPADVPSLVIFDPIKRLISPNK